MGTRGIRACVCFMNSDTRIQKNKSVLTKVKKGQNTRNGINLQLNILESLEDYRICQTIHNVKCWIFNSQFLYQQEICAVLEQPRWQQLQGPTPVHGAGHRPLSTVLGTKRPRAQKRHIWTE